MEGACPASDRDGATHIPKPWPCRWLGCQEAVDEVRELEIGIGRATKHPISCGIGPVRIREFPGQCPMQQDAKSPYICRCSSPCIARVLGCHEHPGANAPHWLPNTPDQIKIDQSERSAAGWSAHHDVRGLDVRVHEIPLMQVLECTRHLKCQAPDIAGRESLLAAQHGSKCLARHIVEQQVRRRIRPVARADDVRMGDRTGHPPLALQTAPCPIGMSDIGAQQLRNADTVLARIVDPYGVVA